MNSKYIVKTNRLFPVNDAFSAFLDQVGSLSTVAEKYCIAQKAAVQLYNQINDSSIRYDGISQDLYEKLIPIMELFNLPLNDYYDELEEEPGYDSDYYDDEEAYNQLRFEWAMDKND